MKIINICKKENTPVGTNIYEVTFKLNIFKRMFGSGTITKEYKDTGNVYDHFSNITVYIDKDGNVLGPFHKVTDALDCFKRRF